MSRTRTWNDLGGLEKFFINLVYNVFVFFLGGLFLMWLSAWVLPVGFGYWASAAIILLSRCVWSYVSYDITKAEFKE